MTSGGVRVIHLKYADADSVSFLIEDMFKPKSGDSAPRNPFFEEYFSESGGEKPQARNPKVNVTSDSRTNTLIVSAPTDLLDVIERVVHELDADPTSEDTLFIYHLRNSQAANLETVLNNLFGNNNNNPQQNQPGQPGQPGQNAQQQQQMLQANQGEGNSVTQSPSTLGNQSRTASQATNRQTQSAMHKLSPSNAQAVNELTGKVFVVADLDTNSLLVTTATKFEKQVRHIIDDLDQPVPQVLIKVLIAEVTHDNSEDSGLDFSLLNVRPSGFGTSGGDALGDAATATANGGLVVTVLEKNVAATLHALSTAGKLDVLSRPYILASDNQEASILVGESVPFITESRLDSLNNTVNTVQYQDIGIQLDVTPHINPDGLVILDVSPQISSMTDTNIQLSAGVESPVFQRRSAQSHVAIMNGKTIVIGGLMQDQKTSTITGIPILEDLPFVGRVFQRRQTDKTKTELLIFLTPHVAQRPDALPLMSEDEMNGTKLTPHAVAPGVFRDQMRGMRRGDTSQSQSTQPVSPVDSIDLGDSGDHTPTTQPTDASTPPNRN
jgi:general secretion pathway protein D